MEEDGTYNGWTNYETWNVALWFANVQELYVAQNHLVGLYSYSPERLAKAIQVYVTEKGHFGDLNKKDLFKVDWEEIANNWIADWEEENK